MDNLQLPKRQSPSRLRRHGSRIKSGLSSPRLRRRDGCFEKGVALHAAPICWKDWKPFVVLAHSFANISCGATLAPTCRAAGEKRTSHAKPPAAGASDRGSARLRLRAGRTTRSLLSCLVPPSKRPSDRRGQGEAAPNRCKPQTKGQIMSTTNNQSIQQINTAALRGTREAHQPDEIKPTTMKGTSMNADQFATEIKRLRDAINNSTENGELLCDELACRPDIAEAAIELASVLCLIAGITPNQQA